MWPLHPQMCHYIRLVDLGFVFGGYKRKWEVVKSALKLYHEKNGHSNVPAKFATDSTTKLHTNSPTALPTTAPRISPMNSPTNRPTHVPTNVPTNL